MAKQKDVYPQRRKLSKLLFVKRICREPDAAKTGKPTPPQKQPWYLSILCPRRTRSGCVSPYPSIEATRPTQIHTPFSSLRLFRKSAIGCAPNNPFRARAPPPPRLYPGCDLNYQACKERGAPAPRLSLARHNPHPRHTTSQSQKPNTCVQTSTQTPLQPTKNRLFMGATLMPLRPTQK